MVSTIKDTANKIYHYGKTIVTGRLEDLPPQARNIVAKYGDAVISSLTINRSPVNSLITGIIKTVSSTPYDKLFHLFLTLHTNKGDFVIEKNEVIHIKMSPKSRPQTESMQVATLSPPITLADLIEKTKAAMGDKFCRYSAYDTNCQHFVLALLRSCGVKDTKYTSFVKQDTASIFQSHPALRRYANTVTDIAGRADVALHGVGVPNSFSAFSSNAKKKR